MDSQSDTTTPTDSSDSALIVPVVPIPKPVTSIPPLQQKRLLSPIFKIGALVLGILLLFGILSYVKIIDIGVFSPVNTSPKPKPTLPLTKVPTSAPVLTSVPITDFVEKCPLGDDATPMLRDVLKEPTRQVGALWGMVTSFIYDTATQTATMQVTSVQGNLVHTFQLKEQPGLVFDDLTQQPKTLASISTGKVVQLSFQCDANTKNIFTITQVSLMQN